MTGTLRAMTPPAAYATGEKRRGGVNHAPGDLHRIGHSGTCRQKHVKEISNSGILIIDLKSKLVLRLVGSIDSPKISDQQLC